MPSYITNPSISPSKNATFSYEDVSLPLAMGIIKRTFSLNAILYGIQITYSINATAVSNIDF